MLNRNVEKFVFLKAYTYVSLMDFGIDECLNSLLWRLSGKGHKARIYTSNRRSRKMMSFKGIVNVSTRVDPSGWR